ncbi:MAG: 5-deoxy-glucuronate isomerase, partial [Anaerolineae bacterium]|nr:5-deoxy-glucuronate isomerase [Anaerolineae bacterium]
MSSPVLIRSSDHGQTGTFAGVTAEEAGWEHLNMAARRLQAGMAFSGRSGDYETAHVI